MGAGASISVMPSMARAQQSAKKIYGIIEEKSLIDAREKKGEFKVIQQGEIDLKNVTFKYPSRNMLVLANLYLKIPANQSVAIVGYSGSGKSTIAQLLLRLYDN
mmetsp:Transcript_7498/g.6810  ORF Transcript_7498/g.6810 Transcript_7498/m.6810 type:complete len:104 (-) Transcript_7498:1161-1472(-)